MIEWREIQGWPGKELRQRHFLEWRDADDLKDFVQTWFQLPGILQNSDEQVGTNRGPDLDACRVRGSADKVADAEMLFDPAEVQFDLPAGAIQLVDLEGTGAVNKLVSTGDRQQTNGAPRIPANRRKILQFSSRAKD